MDQSEQTVSIVGRPTCAGQSIKALVQTVKVVVVLQGGRSGRE